MTKDDFGLTVRTRWIPCPICIGVGRIEVTDEEELEVRQVQGILEALSIQYHVPVEDIVGPSRRAEAVLARDHAAWGIRTILKLHLKTIGYHLGERDHSTIVKNIARHTARRKREGLDG